MQSVGNTLVGAGSSLPLDARVAVGAGVFTVGSAETSAAVSEAPEVVASGQKLPAYNYNAFEFSYRSDFGKIILLEQNVETGQEITQVPTEYHLQQYAQTQRQQRVQQVQQLYRGTTAEGGSGSTGTAKAAAVVSTGTKTSAAPSGPSAPAASGLAAPAVAASTPAAAPAAHVDIKV